MLYYEVLIGDLQFHGNGALTYGWESELMPGSVVRIALRSRSVLGFILRQVPKPSFAIKPIAAVASYPPVPTETLRLIAWLNDYYPAPFGTIVRQFLPPTTIFPKGSSKRQTPDVEIQTDTPDPVIKITVQKMNSTSLPPLTSEQNEAIKSIKKPGSYLLHGITGSGKTRVYLDLTSRTLDSGRSVIILTPEIGLTEGIAQAFQVLSQPIYILHSRLTAVERRNIWYEILNSNEPIVVIGPRSALFSPIRNIGLIVMDESHDQAYKNDSSPRYRTERVAATLATLHEAIYISGSATPNIEDYFTFTAKDRPIISLKKLAASEHKNVILTTVDMRDSTQFGRSRIITSPLIKATSEALGRHEQTLLFLNRRGTASAVMCSICSWRAVCSHCDLPLTYHGDVHITRCHTCGRSSTLPKSCPDCQNTEIILKTIGTKALVTEVERLFPTARIKRFDTDVNKAEQLEQQLQSLRDGAVDVIVGTQMIAKGLDLPKLSVVGVINADAGLLMPDFSATERTYQLISQVAGRVGRGHRVGTVMLQTYSPDNPVILDALHQDYDSFYTRELAERHTYLFPPYCFLLRLTCLRASSKSAEQAATKLKDIIETKYSRLLIEGPAPTFHPKESDKYKWQLVVKSTSRQKLLDVIHNLPSGWQYDLDPINLL